MATDEDVGLLASGQAALHEYRTNAREGYAPLIDEPVAIGHRTPVCLTWENVSYSVTTKEGKLCRKVERQKTILEDLNGAVLPGQLLAIIGPSGAGKSSLLDVLAGRKSAGRAQGEIKINGQDRGRDFKRLSGYVTQDDCLMGNLTVRETFRFHAAMRMPGTVSAEERERRVQEIINELGLTRAADMYVGTQFRRGVSGGEKKRVSIGCELLTDPPLLFLDEPTSGLDASNSLSVMKALRRLAQKGRTIVCTIHQPRSSIYDLFDRLLILSQGHQVYFGPASSVLDYFRDIGLPCPNYTNPADFLLDAVVRNEKAQAFALRQTPRRDADAETPNDEDPLAVDFNPDAPLPLDDEDEIDVSKMVAVDFHHAFLDHQISNDLVQSIHEQNKRLGSENRNNRGRRASRYATNWLRQFFWLIWRTILNYYRNPMVTYVQLFSTVFFAVLVGLIYLQIADTLSALQDRLGALFFIMTNQCFGTIGSMNNFLEERNIYQREQQAGMYYTSAYFLAKTIIEGPTLLLFPLIFGTISYWMIGFSSSAEQFVIFLFGIMTFAATAASLFLAIGAIAPNQVVASICAPLVVVLFLLFGGFYVNNDNVPVYFVWLKEVSFFNWGFGILVYNELNDFNDGVGFKGVCNCTKLPECTCCSFPNVTLTRNGTTCKYYVTGQQELDTLGLGDTKIWENFVILLGMIVAYRLIAYLALRTLHKEKR